MLRCVKAGFAKPNPEQIAAEAKAERAEAEAKARAEQKGREEADSKARIHGEQNQRLWKPCVQRILLKVLTSSCKTAVVVKNRVVTR